MCFSEDLESEGVPSATVCGVTDPHLLLKHVLRPFLSVLNKTWVFLSLPNLTVGQDIFFVDLPHLLKAYSFLSLNLASL